MFRVGDAEVDALESIMDRCQKDLAPLKSFILPGGGTTSALLQRIPTCSTYERGAAPDQGPIGVGIGASAFTVRSSMA